jgi:DUF1680 family protein
MEVKKITANSNVKDDIGKVAVQYGPIIYCAEWPDNNGKVSNIIVPTDASFTPSYNAGILNGIMELKGEVPVVNVGDKGQSVNTTKKTVTLIPYYSWAHRGKGEMTVWFPARITNIDLVSQ